MRIGAFELHDPVPQLREPHLFITLRPWIDVGGVGTLGLAWLQRHFQAAELGRLRRPGDFYDFTRYRPIVHQVEGVRRVDVPNSFLYYAQRPESHDLLFLHALEPHHHGEGFVESVVELAERLGVRRYCQVGAMYGAGPHTRPLMCSGRASEPEVQQHLVSLGVRTSNYQGPTSIMSVATEQLRELGVGTLNLLVQLPSYARLDEDHRGQETLLRALDRIYGFHLDLTLVAQEGTRQYADLDRAVAADPQAQAVVRQLEAAYDAQVGTSAQPHEEPSLPPAVERLLRDLEEGGSSTGSH